MTRITFGTSGWRSIVGEDFTFENVKLMTQAIADHLKAEGLADRGVIVGYDTRFMGDRFARESASVLTGAGVKTFLCNRDVPTPVISFEILRRQAGGAINFTASHNPPEYNGMKFSPAWGGPALPETTRDIERRVNELMGEFCYNECFLDDALRSGLLEEIDPRDAYLASLEQLVDFDAIAGLGHVAVNPLYGTGRGYLDEPLRRHNLKVTSINDHLDPYFGGFPPEPAAKNIADFIALVKGDPTIRLGLATDGDADRFGIVDADGTYIEPNYIIALLLDYLVRVRGMEGGVARSVATSHLIDAVARKHGIHVYETPVGFKYIGELISQDKIVIGGEESAGLTIKGHVPEKDGIIACLLVAEMVAREGMPVRQLLERLYGEVGRVVTARRNIDLTSDIDSSFADKLTALPTQFAGQQVTDVVTIDGTKVLLEGGGWLLFRKSGTEPVVRLYGEAASDGQLEAIMKSGREFILS
jgi:alpha-D-glucose phosphate-specific phosphoglucomutase